MKTEQPATLNPDKSVPNNVQFAIYARCASAEALSIPEQVRQCREDAEKNGGATVTDKFVHPEA